MLPTPPRILVVDDEPYIVELVQEFLTGKSYHCTGTNNPAEALRLIERETFDLIITDLKMGSITGMDILRAARSGDAAGSMVVLMTAYPTIENAIDALLNGAENFILKPFSLEALQHVIASSLEKQRLARENVSLKESLALYRASEALEAPLELPEYLTMVLDVAVDELEGTVAQLVLLEEEAGNRTVEQRITRGSAAGTEAITEDQMVALADTLAEESGALARSEYDGHGPLLALPLRTGGEMVGLLTVQKVPGAPPFTPAQAKALTIIGSGAAVAIKNARLYNSLQEQYLGAIRSLVAAVEAKDPYTRGHSEKVGRLAQTLALEMGAGAEVVDAIRVAGLLHDAGKIGIPESILLKKGSLTGEEYEVIKGHVAMSEKIVEPLPLPALVKRMISEHHERLDGSGYPHALAGDEISPGGRILTVIDIFDSVTSDRIYRARMSTADAFTTLDRLVTGGKIDGACVRVLKEIVTRPDRGEHGIPAV